MKLSIRWQFIIIFVLTSLVSLLLLSTLLQFAIEKEFDSYVWQQQAKAHDLVIRHFVDFYDQNNTFKGIDNTHIGELAKQNNNYFTLVDHHNELIMTTEDNIVPCCSDQTHKYWKNIYPVMYKGIMIARVNIGQFTEHIYSPADTAFRKSIAYGISVSMFITLLLALPSVLILSTRLSKPIVYLKSVTEDIIRGDLTTKIENRSSIDEIASLIDSINKLRTSLYNQENLRKVLTTNISHELRTPLNIMQNQLEAMVDGILSCDTDRLNSILAEVTRLTGLIKELEKITELETDDFIPTIESIELSSVVHHIATGFEASFKRKNIALELKLDDKIIVNAEKDKLTQVILNLVSNAYKFTYVGSIQIKTYMSPKGKAVLEVNDSGIGMPKSELEKIFERFYRVEPSRNRDLGGAGLGLSIVKKIVDAHHWRIEVESEENIGTTFRVKF